jgi:predicted RNase H-like HicB family nuclease
MTNVNQSAQYPIEVHYSAEDDGFIALARDLPGCSAFGTTQAEAIAEIQDAIQAWQEAAQAAGNPVPEPSRLSQDELPSGRVLLRLPRSLHATLIQAAKNDGVSLNQHMVSLLSAGVTVAQVSQLLSQRLLSPATCFTQGSFNFAALASAPLRTLDLFTVAKTSKVHGHALAEADWVRWPTNEPVVIATERR